MKNFLSVVINLFMWCAPLGATTVTTVNVAPTRGPDFDKKMEALHIKLPPIENIEKCGRTLRPEVRSGKIGSEAQYHARMKTCTTKLHYQK